MDDKYKKVYDLLSINDKTAFRAALASGDLVTVGAYCRSFAPDKPQQPPQLPPDVKRGRGRPDMGLSQQTKREHWQDIKQIRNTKSNNIIEHIPGEVVPAASLDDFQKDYENIINKVCTDFYSVHDDLVKKSPFMWFNSLLYELKKELPAIDYKDAQRVGVAWDLFTGLMFKIGLFPTMEAFTTLTGIYKQQLFKELTPAHTALKQKIYNDCKNNMVAQVGYNPMTQVNKMFLLKSMYGFKESAAGDLVQDDKKQLNVDDIPLFLPGGDDSADI